MENTKAKNVVITILVILLLCCLGFITWQYVQLNDNKVPEVSTQDKVNTEVSQKEEAKYFDETKVDMEEINKLYSYVPVNGETNMIEKNAYQSKKITTDDLPVEYLLARAFDKLELELTDAEKEKVYDEENKEWIDDWYYFSADKLQEKVKEIYGKELENKSFNIAAGAGCFYENNKYRYSYGGGSGEGMQNIRRIDKVYRDGNNIYIEDRYICVMHEFNDKEKAWICNTSEENATVIEKFNSIDIIDYDEEEICNIYNDKMKKYKHTFKLSEEGTYYWYSTEPIN